MLCTSAAYAVVRCLSVGLSVTFVYSVETSRHIFNNLSLSDSHTVLVFRTKRYGNILTGTPPPNEGVEGPRQGCSPTRHLLDVPNAHRSTARVPITVLLYNGPLLCGFDVAIK